MGIRRLSREMAMHVLFAVDVCRMNEQDAWDAFRSSHEEIEEQDAYTFAQLLVAGVLAHQSDIDALISEHAKNWDLPRLASIDRAVLRIGTYELIYESDTPENVVINEAVEIAKDYSTDESGKFVNGVLDTIKKERVRESQ